MRHSYTKVAVPVSSSMCCRARSLSICFLLRYPVGQGNTHSDQRAVLIGFDFELASQFANRFPDASKTDASTIGPEFL
jgi:hypothetical protein